MQPHDRAERQRRRHREDERGALVAPATDPHHCREERHSDRQPECPRAQPTGAPDRARRCTACTSRHRPRPGAGASDPDSPRDRRSRSRPTRRRAAAPPIAVAITAVHIRRVAANQTTSGQRKNFAASVTPTARRLADRTSRNRQATAARKTEHQGHVPGLDGRVHWRPQETTPKQRQSRTPSTYGIATAAAARSSHDHEPGDVEGHGPSGTASEPRERRIDVRPGPGGERIVGRGYGFPPSRIAPAASIEGAKIECQRAVRRSCPT